VSLKNFLCEVAEKLPVFGRGRSVRNILLSYPGSLLRSLTTTAGQRHYGETERQNSIYDICFSSHGRLLETDEFLKGQDLAFPEACSGLFSISSSGIKILVYVRYRIVFICIQPQLIEDGNIDCMS
jgi:hypothetical protein